MIRWTGFVEFEPPKQFSLRPACAAVALGNCLLGCLGLARRDEAARLNLTIREWHG
jgi:hypothetical protein